MDVKSIYIWKLEVWLMQGKGGGWQIVLELNWLSRHTFRLGLRHLYGMALFGFNGHYG